MKKYWKRNAVIAALVIFVGAAVVLNWRYNNSVSKVDSEYAEAEDSGKLLGESTYVSVQEDGAADENAVYGEDDYFSTVRLSRQKARDAAVALLEEALDLTNLTAEETADTSQALEAMANVTMTESTIEGIIMSKGFEDCVAFAGDGDISIVVPEPEGGLTVNDVAKITDVVVSELGYTSENIKIVGV